MRKLTVETKVGVFFVFVFALIAFVSTRLGNYGFATSGNKRLSAVFRSSAGVSEGCNVLLAGIKIGFVEKEVLEGSKARVFFKIQPGVNIPDDSSISIQSHGFLGQKYLEIVPGSSKTYMTDGRSFDNITESGDLGVLTNSMDEIAQDIKAITGNLRKVLGTEEGEENIREVFESLNTITTSLAEMLDANQRKIDQVMTNFQSFSADLAYVSRRNRDDLSRAMAEFPAIAENLRVISGNMAGILDRNNEEINQTLSNLVGVTENLSKSLEAFSNIAQKIDSGQGTLGKLVNDDSTADSLNEAVQGVNDYIQRVQKLQMEVGYRGEYHIQQGEVKSYFNLNIRPRFDKIYMISLVDAPTGRSHVTKTETETVSNPGAADEDTTHKRETKRVTTDQLLISAQFAKRWHDFLFRGGIIESHGGAGIEYFLWNDHINLAFEVFDFQSDNYPHMKGYVTGYFLDHFLLTAGVDDFINRYDDPRYFVGAGIYFTDQDLTYLASKLPTSVP